MRQLKTLIVKEWKYLIKTQRIWAIMGVTIFFAFLDPIALKLLPTLLEGQFGGLDLTQFIEYNETAAVKSFFANQLEIASIAILLVTAGQLANEVRKEWILIPHHACDNRSLYPLSKFIANVTLLLPFVLTSVAIASAYSALLFDGSLLSMDNYLSIALGLWIHFSFIVALVLLFDSFILPLGVSIGLSLASIFAIGPILGIVDIYWPDQAMSANVSLLEGFSLDTWQAMGSSVIVIALLVILSSQVFKRFQLRR